MPKKIKIIIKIFLEGRKEIIIKMHCVTVHETCTVGTYTEIIKNETKNDFLKSVFAAGLLNNSNFLD